jgi:hypothetical protein
MPVFYYIDFLYDAGRTRFGGVVDGCVSSMVESGCSLREVVMSTEGLGRQVSLGRHVRLETEDIGRFASAYAEEVLREGQRFISFPPMGRVLFDYGFRFDEFVVEEVQEEEIETRSSASLIGLNFTLSEDPAVGRKIKASLSMWEEYILTHGDRDANRHNMRKVLEMVLRIYGRTKPYFGAMNDELHLDTDGACELLEKGSLPAGNEFAIVGKPLMPKLDLRALKRSGLRWKELPDGGALIQFVDRWAGSGRGFGPF